MNAITTTKTFAKRLVGKCLLNVCDIAPPAKSWLKRWGLRAKREWFGGRVVRVHLPDGKNFKLASLSQDYLSFELFWRGAGYYEPITALVARQLVQPGGTFVDVGANIGFFSLVLAVGQPKLKLIAFEPNPRLYGLLRANAKANRLVQVICEPIALSDAEGSALLYLSTSNMSASLRSDFDYHPTGASVTVRTTTLDRYFARNDIGGPLLVKLDVEGHEESVFNGSRRVLSLLKPDIIVEVTYAYSEATITLLKEAGYRFYPITDQACIESPGLIPVVRGRFVFLNYLLSARPRREIEELFGRIEDQVRKIDLRQTSKLVSAEIAKQFRDRQRILAAAAPPCQSISR